MKYIETKIYASSQATEPIMAVLLANGISDISVDDPQDIRQLILTKDKKDWDFIDPSLIQGDDEAVITVYTEDSQDGNTILQKMKMDLMKLKSDEMYGKYGEDVNFGRMYAESLPLQDDWKDKWKEGIKPFRLTDNITVKPTWEDYERKIDELVIEIDPGMAFGTGTHETTRGCSVLLEQKLKHNDQVLDIGTGSGILAIVASLCQASSVDAFEIDPVAVEVAKSNTALNNVTERINVYEKDILKETPDEKYDIIVSNITSGIIKKMLGTIKKILKPGGYIILSGMLNEESENMKKIFTSNDLKIIEEIKENDWYTVLLG